LSPRSSKMTQNCPSPRYVSILPSFLGVDMRTPLSSEQFLLRYLTAVARGRALHEMAPSVRAKWHARKACERVHRISVVYFVQAISGGPIKIGVSRNLGSRLASLQGAHAEQLVVLRTIRGTIREEAFLHRKFAALHMSGEWFRPDTTLLAFISNPHRFMPRPGTPSSE
jgi:hypothetical protein